MRSNIAASPVTGHPARLVRFAARSPHVHGVAAQGLTVTASFLPIVFGLEHELVYVVLVSAIVSLVLNPAILAAPMRLPAIADDSDAARLVRATAVWLAGIAIVIAMVGLAMLAAPSTLRHTDVAFGVALLLPSQGMFFLLRAETVRRLDIGWTMKLRLIYGSALFTLTLLACVVMGSGWTILLANIAACASASVMVVILNRSLGRDLRHALPRPGLIADLRHHLAAARTLSASVLIGNFSVQAGALVVGSLGAFSPLWAVTMRVLAGFQTVGLQLLGPKVDVDVVRELRARERSNLRGVLTASIRLGSVLGVAAAACALAGIWYASPGSFTAQADQTLFLAGAAVYTAASAFLSLIDRILGLTGRQRDRLIWDVARAALTAGCVLLLTGVPLVLGLGLAATLSALAYVVLLYRGAPADRQAS